MKLTNFTIEADQIALTYNGKYLDVHNNYEFRGFNYDILSKQLHLTWTRSHEKWASEKLCGFRLAFRNVSFFNVRERDAALSFKEDTCMSFIGFLPRDMRDDFDSFTESKNVTRDDDMNVNFQSGQALKINCDLVEFIEINEEIIYVALTNEGTKVWRPMWADNLEEYVYRIKSNSNFDSLDEDLQFTTGDIVICERQEFDIGQCLVAISTKT
jgi:hypothetical protein